MELFGAEDLVTSVANDSGRKILTAVIVAAVTTPLSFLVGRYWGKYQARRQWQKKEFLDRVIVSLNIFSEGTLKIRTVMERSLDEVFLNQTAIDKVTAAAKRTTLENPILPIEPTDRWFLLNFVLNAVAEHFVAGQIKMDAGERVTTVAYALFLTCEHLGDERIRKVRAMLVKRELLYNFPYAEEMPKLEREWHADRIKTLRAAAQLYAKEPDNFLILEVCV